MPAPSLRSLARVWWLTTRRAWRENTLLPALAALFAAGVGAQTLRAPPGGAGAYLTVLFAAATVVALLLPRHVPSRGVLDVRRIDLLPLSPARRFLLRPLFGSTFRLVLVAAAAAWTSVGVARSGPGAVGLAMELAQVWGWSAAALLASEVLDRLADRGSRLVRVAVVVAFWAAAGVLSALGRLRPHLAGEAAEPGSAWAAALRTGGGAPAAWEAGAALAALAAALLALAWGRALAARLAAAPPRGSAPSTAAGAVRRVAALAGPRAATFARELAMLVRTPALYVPQVFLFVGAAAGLSAGNPALVAAGFLLWFPIALDLRGADFPMGGLTRLELTPVPAWKLMAARHAGVVFGSAAVVLAAAVVVGMLRGLRLPAASGEAPLWWAYGATLFLLFTVAGRWMSRLPAPALPSGAVSAGMGAAGTASGGLLAMAALAAAFAAAAAIFVGAGALVSTVLVGVDDAGRTRAAAAAASLVHLALYALGLLRDARR